MPLAVLLILALILRLPHLNGSFWLDEAAQALESLRPLSQQLQIRGDFQPPLIHLITHFALYLSPAEWWLRTVGALLPGLITIAVFYYLARDWFSSKVAWVSTLLLTTSTFHIYFSQELRPYSLPAMWAMISWLVLSRLVSAPEHQPWIKIVLLTLVTTLGLYSSYLYPFVIISQFAWVFSFHRRQMKKASLAVGGAALAFLPWLPSFLGQLEAGGAVRRQLSGWDQVVSLTQGKALFLTIGKFIYGVLEIDPTPFLFVSAITLFLLGLAVVKNLARLWQNSRAKTSQSTTLSRVWRHYLSVLVAFTIPLLTIWLVSFLVPVLSPKRVLFLLPFFYLLIGGLLDLLPRSRAAKLLILTLLAINLISTLSYYLNPQLQRENWRDLHAEIVRDYGGGRSLAVFSHPNVFSPWAWYDDGSFPTLATGTLAVSQVPDLRTQFKAVNDYQYVLVFDYLRTLSDPEDRIVAEITSYGFKQITVIDYPQIGFVRVFAKTATLLSSPTSAF